MLEAAKLVLIQRPETNFMIVGQGVLEKPLKEKARDLGIADRVIFTGISRNIPKILAKSDIFVLSSLWEGLPLAAIEAMAAACPVVLTDVGGNNELVEFGKQGLIVPPNDVPILANGLMALVKSQTLRLAMGQSARERVLQQFGIETITEQYQSLYRKIWNEYRKTVRDLQ